jgi:hypothetical protein
MGVFRYMDFQSDRWETDDGKPNPELFKTLKV